MADYFDKPKDPSTPIAAERERPCIRPLVLVVEDHEDTRSLYRYVLELHDYQVVEAAKGADAIRLAKELLPDLVLMDTNLPEIDGLMVTRHIRQQASLRNLPIIFISGHAQPELRAAAFAAGGTDYLVKPLSINDLEASVEKYLAKSQNMSTVAPSIVEKRHHPRHLTKLPS